MGRVVADIGVERIAAFLEHLGSRNVTAPRLAAFLNISMEQSYLFTAKMITLGLMKEVGKGQYEGPMRFRVTSKGLDWVQVTSEMIEQRTD